MGVRAAGAARRTRRLATLAVVLALTGACGAAHDGVPTPARILLVSLDTVRADHAAGTGGDALTPHLAEIAAEGVVFERFYAAANYTLPSHMSLMTGLDPMAHGVLVGAARLSPQVPTLAERLAAAGYHAASFNEAGFVAARYGFDRGFRSYRQLPPQEVVGAALPEVLEWVRDHRDERWFLFLHTYVAHFPYGGYARYREEHPARGLLSDAEIERLREQSPVEPRTMGRAVGGFPSSVRADCTLYNQLAERYDALLGCGHSWLPDDFLESPLYRAGSDLEAIRASYGARVGLADEALGRIRAVLEELGQWEDTLVVVTSDHGEAFFEHGLYQHDFVPFEEVLHVPLVLSWPRGLGREPRRFGDLAWNLDVFPTILALAGAQASPGGGADLSGWLRGERGAVPASRLIHPVVLSAPNRARKPARRVVLGRNWKWIEGYPAFGDPDGLLFDLARDPGETRNLRSLRPEVFERLRGAAEAWRVALVHHPPVNADTGRPLDLRAVLPKPHLTDEERELLEGLGYVE